MWKCIFEYSPKGIAVPDFEVKQLVTEYVKYIDKHLKYDGWANYHEESPVFFYSTSNIFFALKERVAIGELSCDSLIFRFNGKDIPINEYGAIIDWPDGFCDLETSLAESTLRAASARRRVKIFEAEDR